MSTPIEQYAIIGDTETAALVCTTGSIDWLGLPRFDSASCFGALLGDERHGYWKISPTSEDWTSTRTYRGDTMILETTFTTPTGTVKLIDFMPPRGQQPDLVRVVQGVSGTVEMHMDLVVRFDYGLTVPWARRIDGHLTMLSGPNGLVLHSSVPNVGKKLTTVSDFTISGGQSEEFVLTWYPSNTPAPDAIDSAQALVDTEDYWTDWSSRCTYKGPHREEVMRSLLALKALTYGPTGGIVAAATTSLPEALGGERNWDYRYCWLRDATFTLFALLSNGYEDEAHSWVVWLMRAVAGRADQMQIMYGVAGERQLIEYELDHLPGYENSKPVRVGNGAALQFQLDVYGEVMDVLHQTRKAKIELPATAWSVEKGLLKFVEEHWRDPDDGIWEVRGGQQHFTHSKVMAWVAMDRGIKAIERYGMKGPIETWRKVRDEIHADIMANGWNEKRQAFTQFYGSEGLDASILMLPLVGFIKADDPKMRATVEAVKEDLYENGFVKRYATDHEANAVDGLKGKEGAFLPCTFWLADNLAMSGEVDEARSIFERLCALSNDVGLLAEEYDSDADRQLGNFPQAFTHVALVNTAMNLVRYS